MNRQIVVHMRKFAVRGSYLKLLKVVRTAFD